MMLQDINSSAMEKKRLEKIVSENLPLVHSLIKRYQHCGVEYDDLFQIGTIGLYNAAKRFDESLGYAFSTYAASLIIGEIKRFLRDDGMIKVSRHLKEVSAKASMHIKAFSQKHQREPSISELAEISGISPEDLTAAFEAVQAPVSIFEESPAGTTIADTYACDDADSEKILDRLLIKNVISTFEMRERKIIVYRYFKDKTQKETATLLGISQVQVSRIEKKLLEKIRKSFDAGMV